MATRKAGHSVVVAVSAMGGRPAELAAQAAAARAAGAEGIRLYHAGLASGTDLVGIATLTKGQGS